jgi:hypothetical protein
VRTKTYRRRWGVLLVFCWSCTLQGALWNTWGPIAESAEAVFGWSDATIGMMPNWGNIGQLLTLIPQAWFMDVKGELYYTHCILYLGS